MVLPQDHAPAVMKTRLLPLNKPSSFLASLRAASVQTEEFRLHLREARESEVTPEALQLCGPSSRICVLGFVLPKRVCKHAVRRNLIRRVARACLHDHLKSMPGWPVTPPVLVFKLTRKLPETFTSAASPALAQYVRVRIQALLQQYARRSMSSATLPQPKVLEQVDLPRKTEGRP